MKYVGFSMATMVVALLCGPATADYTQLQNFPPKAAHAYSVVGADEAKNDFFEHVDPARLSNYVAPTPEPTPAPTPEPTAAATAVPAQPADAKEPESWSKWAGIAVGFLAAVVPSTIFVAVRMRKTNKKYRRILKEQGLEEPKRRNERKQKR